MRERTEQLRNWLANIGDDEWFWFAKRLSANDTGLTGGHQVGFYIPGDFALTVAPELAEQDLNPRRQLCFTLVSHDQRSEPNLIYYNSRLIRRQANGRNEFRVTGFGGRRSALQDPDSTGSILVTAWDRSNSVEAWLASGLEEEEAIEGVLGPVEPSTNVTRTISAEGKAIIVIAALEECAPDIEELPEAWASVFPSGRDLTAEAIRRRPATNRDVDHRLVDRYRCEFGLFRVVEAAHTLPLVAAGFKSVEEFLGVAQTVANRRKARAGRSLELHLRHVFDEERVVYETGASTEDNRRPDFLFPSMLAYQSGRPTLMLGVKTSVKDRWRQVLDEAAKISEKHLFTLSEGVSPNQFKQMQGSGIRLVVPADSVRKFPVSIRPKLLTLASFIDLVRVLR
jgi:hypothetical protein